MATIIATAYATAYVYDAFGITWASAYLVAINVVAFVVYVLDKAFPNLLEFFELRVPEVILIWGLAFPGGILGALLAMLFTGHKTSADKRTFRFWLSMSFVLQVAILFGLLIVSQRGGEVSLQFFDELVESVVRLVLDVTQPGLTFIKRLLN